MPPHTPEHHPGWDTPPPVPPTFPEAVWDRAEKPPYVHVVNTAAEAQRIMAALQRLVAADKVAAGVRDEYERPFWSRRVFACDTEVRVLGELI